MVECKNHVTPPRNGVWRGCGHFTYFQCKVHVGEEVVEVWLAFRQQNYLVRFRKRFTWDKIFDFGFTWDTNPSLWGTSPVFDPSVHPRCLPVWTLQSAWESLMIAKTTFSITLNPALFTSMLLACPLSPCFLLVHCYVYWHVTSSGLWRDFYIS